MQPVLKIQDRSQKIIIIIFDGYLYLLITIEYK
jgi:hypothetical protein